MKSLMTFVLTAASSMFALTTYAQNCPARLAPGSIIPDPPMVYAKDGAIGGTLYAYYDGDPAVGRSGRYCLMYSGDPAQPPIEAPVFRVAPGDRLNFSLANRMPDTPPMEAYDWNAALGTPCTARAVMQEYDTNIHFHGTNVTPACGSDEVITTLIAPMGAAWQYNVPFPANAPPGLDWYHPHVHGVTQEQMLGGMTGALIIDAPNQMPNVVAGLRERVLIVRDQERDGPPAGVRYVERPDVIEELSLPIGQRELFGANGRPLTDAQLHTLLSGGTVITSDSEAPGAAPLPSVVPPWKDLSVNNVQVKFQPSAAGVAAYSVPGEIRMEATREFWRVANVAADSYLRLQVREYVGDVALPQILRIAAMDGAPISAPDGRLLFDDGSPVAPGPVSAQPHKTIRMTEVLLPPAGRAEFIVAAPAAGHTAELVAFPYETNADSDPLRVLARIVGPARGASPNARHVMPQPTASAPRRRFVDTGSATPKAKPDHLLYMSENDEEFFITEDASTSASNPPPVPTAFSMLSGPSIYVPSGSIQEWKIENRTNEAHAFHIHQVHFRVLQRVPAQSAAVDSLDQVALRDTVDLPAYSGVGDPPSVTLRVFFNEPDIRGNFLYHCHILEHEDKGMMAIVRVVDRSEMPVALKSGGKRVAVAGQRGGAGPKLVQPVALQSLGRDDRDRSRADQEEEAPILRDRNGEVIDGQFCSATSQKYPLRSASTRQSSKRVSRVKISEIRSLLP